MIVDIDGNAYQGNLNFKVQTTTGEMNQLAGDIFEKYGNPRDMDGNDLMECLGLYMLRCASIMRMEKNPRGGLN